jgi:hypothetical protein
MPLLPLVAAFLLPGFHKRSKVRIRRQTADERVKVIWHPAVRNCFKVKPRGRDQKLVDYWLSVGMVV